MRVRPTHYTIKAFRLQSWVVQRSMDGKAWKEIDRKTNSWDFRLGWAMASFAVSKLAECRFIRLTQTGKRYDANGYLSMKAFEFFGTLVE
jgi:hypothetical protein